MSDKYGWSQGSHMPHGVDANAVAEELNKLGNKVVPEIIVQKAKSPRSAMHPCFEWDDSVAAHEYRLTQARHLARSLVVSVQRADGEPRYVRAFVSVQHPEDEENTYTPYAVVMSDDWLRQQALARVKAQLQAIRERYSELEELAEVFTAIDRLREPTAA